MYVGLIWVDAGLFWVYTGHTKSLQLHCSANVRSHTGLFWVYTGLFWHIHRALLGIYRALLRFSKRVYDCTLVRMSGLAWGFLEYIQGSFGIYTGLFWVYSGLFCACIKLIQMYVGALLSVYRPYWEESGRAFFCGRKIFECMQSSFDHLQGSFDFVFECMQDAFEYIQGSFDFQFDCQT